MKPGIEVVVPSRALVGEGPVWDPLEENLLWVDILNGEVHRFNPRSGADSVLSVDTHVGAVATTGGRGLILATTDGFGHLDEVTGELTELAVVDPRPSHRMNDGTVDSRGRFWAGTMGYEPKAGTAALYRLNTDLTTVVTLSGIGLSNGLGWSPADDVFYYIDSLTQRISAFDWDPESGIISRARTLVEVPQSDGSPDGLAVDSDGCLWVGMFGGSAVNRYTPDGWLERRLSVPTSGVTCAEFGGSDLSTLFITTATYGKSDREIEEDPIAGSVLAVDVGVCGMAPNHYTGELPSEVASTSGPVTV